MGNSESCRTAVGGGDHDLIGVFLPEIPYGEDARNARLTFLIGYHIADGTHFDADGHKLVIGEKACKDEDALSCKLPLSTSLCVFDRNCTDPVVIGLDFSNNRIEEDFYPGLGDDTLLENPACPKGIPTVDQVDDRFVIFER